MSAPTEPKLRRFGLISDTHGQLHEDVFHYFKGVEAIIHAGDVGDDAILEGLETIAPVYAVAGNCDLVGVKMPIRREVELPFGIAAIAHGHTFSPTVHLRVRQMIVAFRQPRLRLIVTGHSHKALVEKIEDVLVVNPGAACPPRLGTKASIAVLGWYEPTDKLKIASIDLEWE